MKFIIVLLLFVSSICTSQVSISFDAENTEQLNNQILDYVKQNKLINTERTDRQKAALNVFEKLVGHLPSNKYHIITREDLKTFVNYCHDPNGNMIFPVVDPGLVRKIQFVPSEGSTSSNIIK